MALDETAGGLPADETQIKATMPKTGGLTLAGQKGVSLNPADSSDIRDRLMQMITQREQAASGWGPIMERAAVSAGGPGTFAQNLQSFGTNQRNKEKELFDMRVGLAQLNTEEARVKQAQEQAAKQQFMINNILRVAQGLTPLPEPSAGGAAPQGMPVQGGAAPQGMPAQGGAEAPPLNALQASTLAQLAAANPQEALKQMLTLTKPTDLQRELSFLPANVRNQIITAAKAGNMYQPFKYYDPKEGREMQTSAAEIIGKMFNVPSQFGAAPPTGPAPVGGPAPVAAAPVAAAPVAAAPAPRPAPVVSTAPSGNVSPALASILNMPNPNPRSSPSYAEFEAERNKKAIEQQAKEAAVGVAGDTKEAEKMGETLAAEQGALRAAVDAAPTNILLANRVMQDVKEHKELFAKLNQPSLGSALAGLMKSGVQIGQFGSISVPGINDFLQQVDPGAKDDPKRLEAWTRITASMAQINLDYAQRVMKGQGAVSNFERELVERAVGDINRDSARNMMVKMKMLEIASANAQQINDKWEVAQKAGQSWQQFKSSPIYKEMKRDHYYNTAKVMHIKNPPKYPGDA
jgi:hypothetical protein